ncbi:MAG TPA: hypothetical protein VFZ21_31985 [Gemmatimonadaceae bacterium]|jgi:hypothetical protein|nr:hypothetical protein [Gemmatimonadaceae bacterium]
MTRKVMSIGDRGSVRVALVEAPGVVQRGAGAVGLAQGQRA